MKFVYFAVFCTLLHSCTLIRADIDDFNFESCPRDSRFSNGICKCDHSLCKKPPCLSTLQIISNKTNYPGECCPMYSCEGCKGDDQIEGKCPCAHGAVLDSLGKCECVDPHKTIFNDTCLCDALMCELPEQCDERRTVAVRELIGCCEKVTCITCPEDSYPTTYDSEKIENKCVCHNCPKITCKANQRKVIVIRGNNTPGKCCDIYSCKNVECSSNGTNYLEGDEWYLSDGEKCKCQNGVSLCTSGENDLSARTCSDGSNIYHHQQTWMQDVCTNCTCINGVPKCIAHMCDVQTSVFKPNNTNCAPLKNCKKYCEYGFKLNNKTGCEICKCRLPTDKVTDNDKIEKYKQLDALFKEYNLTEADAVLVIKRLYEVGSISLDNNAVPTVSTTKSTTAKSNSVPVTSVCRSITQDTYGNCSYSCILEYGVPGFAIGGLFAGLLLFLLVKFTEKNRQKYKMTAYTYKPVGKETHDKSLNFPSIIKAKTLELQSYNEKKNVI